MGIFQFPLLQLHLRTCDRLFSFVRTFGHFVAITHGLMHTQIHRHTPTHTDRIPLLYTNKHAVRKLGWKHQFVWFWWNASSFVLRFSASVSNYSAKSRQECQSAVWGFVSVFFRGLHAHTVVEGLVFRGRTKWDPDLALIHVLTSMNTHSVCGSAIFLWSQEWYMRIEAFFGWWKCIF